MMDRLKVVDRALFVRQIGGISMIVIMDVIYLVISPFYGRMEFDTVGGIILFVNMLNTCILYHNFLLSRGESGFELNTEKIVYFPTTRPRFLLNKYSRTLVFLLIQILLTLVCLWLGRFAVRGEMESRCFLYGCLFVLIGVLATSGAAILLMHLAPWGLYLSMLLFYPLMLHNRQLEQFTSQFILTGSNEIIYVIQIIAIAFTLWLLLLGIGVKIYEKVT